MSYDVLSSPGTSRSSVHCIRNQKNPGKGKFETVMVSLASALKSWKALWCLKVRSNSNLQWSVTSILISAPLFIRGSMACCTGRGASSARLGCEVLKGLFSVNVNAGIVLATSKLIGWSAGLWYDGMLGYGMSCLYIFLATLQRSVIVL